MDRLMKPPSSAASATSRRRAGIRWLSSAAALVLLAGCSQAAVPSGPAPVSGPVPENLGETPEMVQREIVAPRRDILGSVNYDLPVEANSWVEEELDFLVGQRRAVISRWLERGDPYEAYIKGILAEERVPTDLYYVAMIESGFVATARSHAGAVGFWQFMPATGRSMGLRVDSLVDERMDPVRSTRAAARHLRSLHRIYGDWALAAAAYNAGSGRVSRAMQAYGASNFWDLAQRGNLAAETKHYVPRLYAMTIIGRDRARFGFSPSSPRPFAYDSMLVEYAAPLQELAALGEPTTAQLASLNPHLHRGQTPSGPYWVWLPPATGVAMQRAWLASEYRKNQGMGIYVVRSGDSLGRLAQISGLRSARIRELNPGVDFDRLRTGERLRLPQQVAQQLSERRAAPAATVAAATPASATPASAPAPAPAAAPSAATRSAAAPASPARGSARSSGQGTTEANGVTHTVQGGETLWAIARDHGVSVAALQEMNGMADATIRAGQTLRVPQSSSATAASAAASAAAVPVEHTVEGGESLWGIARKHGTTVDAIRTANELGDRPIQPGQKLQIPASR
jgi:membrane-bound lytic murein transglycosylase D